MNFFKIPTPCYVLEEDKLKKNLKILNFVQIESGAKVLLALKGYAFWRSFELIRDYIKGCCASGIYEAMLAFEEFGSREIDKEICVFSPAYKNLEMEQLLPIATHIIFNSFAQWQKFKNKIENKNKHLQSLGFSEIEVGLRVNPLYSEVQPPIYNPCISGSRLGITPSEFEKGVRNFGLEGIQGLHFHTHCEQNSDVLERTLVHFEKYFKPYASQMKWFNFGGGHHITRSDYDVQKLIAIIKDFRARYGDADVFLEPGEAVGWQSGFLIGEVVDIVWNEIAIAILDVSASAHMPDCLEMPYRPNVKKISLVGNEQQIEEDKGEKIGKYSYRFGGPTCLAGDVIGDYSFETPLNVGDKILFEDMMHYTIVKNNTFNGVPLPSLGVISNGEFRLLKNFDYNDYKNRN
ncbi:carboxynorspermidine decarboxylase [Helicobacter sp. 12S02232-10]|uniref:carboxynorspermidine decarboxylase n=1 Tax=Helicobacter sp. 12S02232-10 TaxID=1476197 RepID=UPI000BA631A1|nr:carboxynorspermidine decarboxylase [Helicobacter sp. 12S02232-10]PAF49144.1 carboxynorspermidine decarboxylase [Helicobacter sp. 12S02232-10]